MTESSHQCMFTSQKDTVWPTNIFGEARNQKHNTQASINLLQKDIDQWTYQVERRENLDANLNYIFSLRLKYTLLVRSLAEAREHSHILRLETSTKCW